MINIWPTFISIRPCIRAFVPTCSSPNEHPFSTFWLIQTATAAAFSCPFLACLFSASTKKEKEKEKDASGQQLWRDRLSSRLIFQMEQETIEDSDAVSSYCEAAAYRLVIPIHGLLKPISRAKLASDTRGVQKRISRSTESLVISSKRQYILLQQQDSESHSDRESRLVPDASDHDGSPIRLRSKAMVQLADPLASLLLLPPARCLSLTSQLPSLAAPCCYHPPLETYGLLRSSSSSLHGDISVSATLEETLLHCFLSKLLARNGPIDGRLSRRDAWMVKKELQGCVKRMPCRKAPRA